MSEAPTFRRLGASADGTPIGVDLAALTGSHVCVAANSGGGKSGAIRRLLEATHGQVQHIVLDAEDEFYTLRERFEYVIAGGDDGDAPARPGNAFDLARAALAHDFSLIAQLNDLGDSAGLFISAFLDGLMSAPRELWRPVLVVIDEAQRFAPQNGAGDAAAAVKDLLQRGRKRGFTGVLATTRVSELNAGVRGLTRNWLLGMVGQALDRRTTADQLGFGAKSKEALALQTLERRHFWGFGPAISREPALFRIDDCETTIVEAGQAHVPTPPAPEALRAILSDLRVPDPVPSHLPDDTIPADPTSAARKGAIVGGMLKEREERIAELEAANAELRAEVEHLSGVDAECDRYNAGIGAAIAMLEAVQSGRWTGQSNSSSAIAADDEDGRMTSAPFKTATKGPRTGSEAGSGKPPAANASLTGVTAGETAPHLPPRRVRLLEAIAEATSFIERPSVERAMVAWLAGTSPTSSTFEKDCSALRTHGLLDYPSPGELKLTAGGADHAIGANLALDLAGVRHAVLGALPPRRQAIIEALFGHMRPDGRYRTDVAYDCDTSSTSSTFEKDCSAMRTLGLLTYPAPGRLRAADFLLGRDRSER